MRGGNTKPNTTKRTRGISSGVCKLKFFVPYNLRQQHERALEDTFAGMRITESSQSNVSQTSFYKPPSAAKQQPANKKKTSKKKPSSLQGRRNNHPNFEEYEHGYAPVVPPIMYRCLQEIVGYVKHLDTHKDDDYIQTKLEGAEGAIQVFANYYVNQLPKDWKYDRATAGRWKQIPY